MRISLLEAYRPGKRDRVFYPLGLGYLAAYLRKACSEIEVKICGDLSELLEYKPDIAGISSTSPYFPAAIDQAMIIKKELDIPVILGGAHISTMPESLPFCFDAGVIGEGELTFLAVVELLTQTMLKYDRLLQIPGLVVRTQNTVTMTQRRLPIWDIDSIPFPMREWNGLSPHLQWMFSSRGCPYRCTFCSSSVLWRGYRAHSAEYVARELNDLVAMFDLGLCIFMDDLFAADLKRLIGLKELIKNSVRKELLFSVTLRAESATSDICKTLKEMGTAHVHLGLESGSDRILKTIKCNLSSVAANQKALSTCHDFGLLPVGSFIIGSPGEDEEDIKKTYEFIEKNLKNGTMNSFSFSPMVPFPGTEVWEYAVKKGIIEPASLDWESLDVDIRYFSGEGYTLMTDRISRKKFMYYFKKFKALYDEYVRP